VDPIKIWCSGSPTLRPITCRWPVVSQPLGALNQYRASNLRSFGLATTIRASNLRSSWPCNNNTSDSQRIMNNSAKWSWTLDHRLVIHVRPLFGRLVLGTTNLLLLLQLCHCSSLIFFWKHIKFLMNIWMNII
jgi:hypothetical protein